MTNEVEQTKPAAKKVAAKKVASKQVGWQDRVVQKPARTPLTENLILKSDSYKPGHWKMLPGAIANMYSYGESRGFTEAGWSEVVWFGMQGILKKHFSKQLTMRDVERAKVFIDRHIRPGAFNYEGWKTIVEEFDGKLPLEICAVPEGTVLPAHLPLWSVQATDERFAWLVSYFEPLFIQVWYPTSVASLSYAVKKMLKGFWEQTVDEGSYHGLNFALHDFGFRGATCVEAAGVGGSGHILSFMGTDTMQAVAFLYDFYGLDEEDDTSMPAFSVYATEHSVVCSHSDAEQKEDLKAQEFIIEFLEKEGGTVSCVADTYDVFRFTDRLKSIFGDRLEALPDGSRFVVRPDSGDPTIVPVIIIKALINAFGAKKNSKGFYVLPPFLRVLQGDGMNFSTIRTVCLNLRAAEISIENIVFGMGGGLLQHVNRETLKVAQKGSAIKKEDSWIDIYKDPITDSGKVSKKGRVTTILRKGQYMAVRLDQMQEGDVNLLIPVWRNGDLLVDENVDVIRGRVTQALATM